MPSHHPTPAQGIPQVASRHRVEAPEIYETWREYAFSTEPEVEATAAPEE